MGDVSASNFVVKEVNGTPWIQFVVWAVNCVEGTLDEVVVIIGKVWDIDVSVLEPTLIFMKRLISVKRMNVRRHSHDHRKRQISLQCIVELTKCREPTRH